MVFNTCINCTNYNVQAVIHFFISLIKMKIKLIDEASFVKMQNITCASIFHYLFQVVWPATYLINGWIDCTPFKLTSIFFCSSNRARDNPRWSSPKGEAVRFYTRDTNKWWGVGRCSRETCPKWLNRAPRPLLRGVTCLMIWIWNSYEQMCFILFLLYIHVLIDGTLVKLFLCCVDKSWTELIYMHVRVQLVYMHLHEGKGTQMKNNQQLISKIWMFWCKFNVLM